MTFRISDLLSCARKECRKSLTPRIAAAVLAAVMLTASLSACQDEQGGEVPVPADYGRYGSGLALELAETWPNRSPGSAQEQKAGQYIADEFEELGYEPEIFPFTYIDSEGRTKSSQNIIVRIPGSGFTLEDEEGNRSEISKQVIVGAHYDVSVTEEQAYIDRAEREGLETEPSETTENIDDGNDGEVTETTEEDTFGEDFELPVPFLSDFDGIHNNAAGVAALMTLAAELKDHRAGYDIVLIAFGASEAGLAGSRAYAAAMSEEEIASTDVMYNINGIYAGDKVYAHAGQNSVLSGDRKIYEMRRKLYEATDVYYENELYSNNEFALYTNQSGIEVPWGAGGWQTAMYREWTLHEADHTPFDQLGIQVVFFESYDYDAASVDAMKESSNPAFAATSGRISGTSFDSSDYLEQLFMVSSSSGSISGLNNDRTDRLTRRINNIAFIIDGAIAKGIHNAVIE
jgi:alkaline phosphatase isozyme conversion protein